MAAGNPIKIHYLYEQGELWGRRQCGWVRGTGRHGGLHPATRVYGPYKYNSMEIL